MPRLDGTGPEGQGSRTGRGMGNCSRCPLCPRASSAKALTKEEQKKLLLKEKEAIEQELANLEK